MKESTRDTIKGLAKQTKGKVKVAAGKLVGNSRLKLRGFADQDEGKVQKRIGAMKKARGR